MSPKNKIEIVSIVHTFIAVFGAAFVANIDSVDLTHLSRETVLAFGIALFRSVVKMLWNKYLPVNNIVDNTVVQG